MPRITYKCWCSWEAPAPLEYPEKCPEHGRSISMIEKIPEDKRYNTLRGEIVPNAAALEQKDDEIRRLKREVQDELVKRIAAERERDAAWNLLRACRREMSGADGDCPLCGKQTNGWSAYPGGWPLYFPTPESDGKPLPHHIECVQAAVRKARA